jgi:hypothetical protein
VFSGMRSFALRLPDSSSEASDAARRLLTCNRHIFIPPVIPENKTEKQTSEQSPGRRKHGAGDPVDRRKPGSCLRGGNQTSIEGSEDTFKVYMANTFKAPHVVPPPPQGANMDTKMQFLHYQLDRIGQKAEVLNGLLLLGSGAQERFEGGAHTLIYPLLLPFVYRTLVAQAV